MTTAVIGSAAGSRTIIRSKTVMVVDDSDLIRRLVSLILRMEGFRVIELDNAKDALKILREEYIDLLITDLNMPGMDGIELVKTIRSRPASAHMPVVMLTSELLDNIRQKAFEAGINEWLPKPFITKHLMNLVTKFVPRETIPENAAAKSVCVSQ